MTTVRYCHHDSPLGPLLLAASAGGVRAITMSGQRHVADAPDPRWEPRLSWASVEGALLERAGRQLDDYFEGRRRHFDLPLDLIGTEFQRRVWRVLSDIAFGQTISYGELARRIGHPQAARAVGLANGRNPVSVVVPCHRVIGADGSLTGYGGGIDRKRFLLALESRVAGVDSPVQRELA